MVIAQRTNLGEFKRQQWLTETLWPAQLSSKSQGCNYKRVRDSSRKINDLSSILRRVYRAEQSSLALAWQLSL